MEHYELGMALAMAQIAELHRQAERRRLASPIPGRAGDRRRDRAPGLPRRPGRDDQAGQTTIAGLAVDQAALHGLLVKVRDLGLPLLECAVPTRPDLPAIERTIS